MLGGGFAGAYVARLLGKVGATIVTPQNSVLYTPLLPAAAGTLEPRHVVVPLLQMCPHERGRVRVGPTLRVEGMEGVWARGECPAVPNARTPCGYRMPGHPEGLEP